MFRIEIHHTRILIDRNSHWDRHSHESMIVSCRSYSWHCARHRARCRVRRANLGIFRYRARAYESAAPRHVTFMSGEQLLLLGSPQDHRLYNSNAQPLVFVELRCPLDGDVPASAAVFRRRRYIPQTSLVAAPAPCIPPRPPRNHYHETGEITRRDGETASWRRGGVLLSPPFFLLRNELGQLTQRNDKPACFWCVRPAWRRKCAPRLRHGAHAPFLSACAAWPARRTAAACASLLLFLDVGIFFWIK